MSVFKDAFAKLGDGDRDPIDLRSVADLVEQFRVPDAEGRRFKSLPEVPADDEPSYEWASLCHLLAGLDGAGVHLDNEHWRGQSMIPDGGWAEYCREFAGGIGDIDVVESYVDWDRFAAAMKTDYTEVQVDDGEFRGTWYVRS